MLICIGMPVVGFIGAELAAINADNVVDISAEIIFDADAMTYGKVKGTDMQSSHKTYEAAKAALLGEGFTRYIEPVQGAERFSKPSKVDDALGGYARDCIAYIKHHWVSPQWGDNQNYFTINFL